MTECAVNGSDERCVSFAVGDGLREGDDVVSHCGAGDETDGIVFGGVDSDAGGEVAYGNGECGVCPLQGLLSSQGTDADEQIGRTDGYGHNILAAAL